MELGGLGAAGGWSKLWAQRATCCVWVTGAVCDRGMAVLLWGAAARALGPFGATASRAVRAPMVLSTVGDVICPREKGAARGSEIGQAFSRCLWHFGGRQPVLGLGQQQEVERAHSAKAALVLPSFPIPKGCDGHSPHPPAVFGGHLLSVRAGAQVRRPRVGALGGGCCAPCTSPRLAAHNDRVCELLAQRCGSSCGSRAVRAAV